MPWCSWVLLGAIAYSTLLLVVWAMLKAAGDDDERMGRR